MTYRTFQAPIPDMNGRKHGIGGYNYGCRCSVCREAKSKKRKEYESSEASIRRKEYYNRVKDTPEYKAKSKARDAARVYDPERSRWQTIHKKYGITKVIFEKMLADQNGVCAICKGKPNRNYLSVDHDHACCPGVKTCGNCIRGLLCAACNAFLGRVNDNPDTLIEYLNKSR